MGSRALARAWPAAAVAVYAVLAVSSMRAKSATFDEPIHLPPGYASLTLGDHRMNPEHPPLVRAIAALPLLFMEVTLREDDHAWITGRPWEFGKRFLYRWNDADRLLFWGRLMVVALGAALGLAVFAWARRLWGPPAGALAVFLYALSPDMLAHGQIVTTDMGIALFIFLTVAGFERLTERATPVRLLQAGLALGGALAAKFSAVGLLPILAALALVVVFLPQPIVLALGQGRVRSLASRGEKAVAVGALLLVMGALAILVVWAAYGFRSPLSPDPAVAAAFPADRMQPQDPLVRGALALVHRAHLLPEAWVYGFLSFLHQARSRPAFLMGHYSETGWWYYFPATFALKTPLPLVLMGAGALALLARRPGPWRNQAFVWLPVVIYVALSVTRSINIGHRHLLPIYPFLFVAAGRLASWAAEAPPRTAARVGLLALAAWYAVGTGAVHPHYLAYFNELAGGPRNGYKHLVDSNLDWGQDLVGLRAYMQHNAVPRIKLLYFGTADPDHHGVACDRLPGYQPPPPSTLVKQVRPGDLVAVSATHLQGVYLDPGVRPLVERLRASTPLASIGHSIFIYRADFAWAMP